MAGLICLIITILVSKPVSRFRCGRNSSSLKFCVTAVETFNREIPWSTALLGDLINELATCLVPGEDCSSPAPDTEAAASRHPHGGTINDRFWKSIARFHADFGAAKGAGKNPRPPKDGVVGRRENPLKTAIQNKYGDIHNKYGK